MVKLSQIHRDYRNKQIKKNIRAYPFWSSQTFRFSTPSKASSLVQTHSLKNAYQSFLIKGQFVLQAAFQHMNPLRMLEAANHDVKIPKQNEL